MKKILLIVCLLIVGKVHAGIISVELSDATPELGDVVTVDLTFSATTEFSSFFSGVEFDSSIFEFVAGSITSDFPDFDLFTFSGLDVDLLDAANGSIFFNLYEDFLFPVTYAVGDYLLASFDLLTIGEGATSIQANDTQTFAPLSFDPVTASGASSGSVKVSAPSAFALLLIAMAGVFGVRRKL